MLYRTGFVWRSLIFLGLQKVFATLVEDWNMKTPASRMFGLCTISYRASFEICIQNIRSQYDWIKPRRYRNGREIQNWYLRLFKVPPKVFINRLVETQVAVERGSAQVLNMMMISGCFELGNVSMDVKPRRRSPTPEIRGHLALITPSLTAPSSATKG